MLKRICLILKPDSAARDGEAPRAVRSFLAAGIAGEIRCGEPRIREGTLCLCEDGEMLRRLRGKGFCAAGYAHAGNTGAGFDGAAYVVQEPDLVDPDSYEKIYQREAGLPWRILETPRCLVREFVTEDLEALYGLYDPAACRFLEPPSPDRERERAILRAYIDRIYGLYGFGHWAVLRKEGATPEETAEMPGSASASAPPGQGERALASPGQAERAFASSGQEKGASARRRKSGGEVLVGRIGFSALTAGQEEELLGLGIADRPDADFGFLIGPKWRGTGLAREVSAALLQYGFTCLGFTCVRADAHRDNLASRRLLVRLGFSPVGEGAGGKQVYLIYTDR